VNFAFDDDQEALRETAARFLRDQVDLLEVIGSSPQTARTAYPPALWKTMFELGWPALIIPEDKGGMGSNYINHVVLTEEMGRALAPCPYLGHHAGTLAILAAGTDDQQNHLLPPAAEGTVQLALAWNEAVRSNDHKTVSTSVDRDGLSGVKRFVIDGDAASHLVVTARDAHGAIRFYLVDAAQPGVQVRALPWMDLTRRVSDITFDRATAEVMRVDVDFAAARSWVEDRVLLALASESAGGSAAVFDMCVRYAKERVQFGRPIGSYQVIKHKCADMLAKVESAKALTYYCAWAVSAAEPDTQHLAASMAKSFCAEAYEYCTAEAIQIHGAVGTTWEFPLHLFYKRARANAALFGSPSSHRRRVMELVTSSGHRV
jgi:acyl-CoA dehydrogenase